jgi:thymidine kinase
MDVDVIGIDEGQFFDDIIEFSELWANKGKIIIIAGLDGTFQRKPFGKITELIPLCETVIKLKAICSICFKDASFSKKLDIKEKDVIDVGGKDKYISVCREHFYK